ncbi:MAG: hypothetical protein HY646_07475 [Acidobacteria bacterium]|nr:hypothetical protein [Acidobacteriota bacterium]
MTWNDVIDRLTRAGLKPAEETYMENYGTILSTQHAEFAGRYFRCAYGVVKCDGLRIEAFLFPYEGHLQEFLEVIGDDPWWVPHQNVIFHFPVSDPVVVGNILDAVTSPR